nr:unnamed protein product [Callosobruchus chinensis]
MERAKMFFTYLRDEKVLKNLSFPHLLGPKTMADEKVARPMKFPYTFSAKLAQFPWKYYFQNQWVFKYYAIAVVCTIPIFKSISNLANSPENVAKWAEIRRKEAAEHH